MDVARLGDFAISISVEPWTAVDDYVTAAGEIQKAIVEAFRHHGIPFAHPELRALATA